MSSIRRAEGFDLKSIVGSSDDLEARHPKRVAGFSPFKFRSSTGFRLREAYFNESKIGVFNTNYARLLFCSHSGVLMEESVNTRASLSDCRPTYRLRYRKKTKLLGCISAA
jgi:hypothetical protein